jgi:hypothetical protein
MNLSKFIIIASFLNILCVREKLKIVNTSNPIFLNEDNPNLVFVFNHMKHGASSPCYGLNDYYADIFEQQWKGYCELTNKGFLQLFKLGRIFNQRYSKLLNITANPDINLVLSYASKENKTLMSSNAFFYGMYLNNNTPTEEQIVIPTRNFKKVPDTELIPIFYFSDVNNCQGWKNLVNKIDENKIEELNDFMSKFIKSYEEVFNSLRNREQMINKNKWFDKINLFCSSYISNYYDERYKNIELFQDLKYTEEKFYDLYYDCHMFNLYKYTLIQYGEDAKNIPVVILSDFLNDMIKYMDLIVNSPESESPKFVSYMGHDSTIAAMQVILHQLYKVPFKLMNFGSNQIFLLFKNDQNYEIKYYYNDELLLSINYVEFKKNILDLMKKNEKDLVYFCQGFKLKDYTFLGLCCTIMALLIANISICIYHKNIFCEKKKYMSIESAGKSVEIKNEI